jgi:uncharacterized membrane protein (DUF4010 family)
LSLARFARDGVAQPSAVAAGIIVANVVMLVRVGVLLAAIARDVLAAIWPVLSVSALIGLVAALILWRRTEMKKPTKSEVDVANPLEIRPALFFAMLLALIALASKFGADQFGEQAIYLVGLISGIADVDALTLTAGRQAAQGGVSAIAAGGAVMLAVSSNIIVKAIIASAIAGPKTGYVVSAVFAGIIAVSAVTYFLL